MRRASTCLAVLGLAAFVLAALGLPAVAGAEVPAPKISKFKAKAVPIPKPGGGTYKETGNIFGAGAAIEVEYEFEGTGYGPSAGNPAGGIPPLSGVNFYLPKGTILHTAGFATCTKEKLEKEGAKGCPAKSQASPLGAALGEVYFGSERVPEEATLQGFFAPGGNLLFFTKYHSGAVNPSAPLGAPAAVEIVSPGHFVPSSGLYSKEFIGEVPKVETVKGAPLASVKLIKVETGAAYMSGKKLISYGTIPLTCPKGGFPLKTEVTFGGEYGGEREFGLPAKTVTAEYKAPCPTKHLKKKK